MNGHRRGGTWIVFAGIMLILAGVNTFLNGLWALNASNRIEATFQDQLLFADKNLDVWGWIYVVVGILVAVAGIAVFGRAPWARWVGILAASVGAITAFFWLFTPNYWVPALVSVVLNVLVVYALASYGVREDVTV